MTQTPPPFTPRDPDATRPAVPPVAHDISPPPRDNAAGADDSLLLAAEDAQAAAAMRAARAEEAALAATDDPATAANDADALRRTLADAEPEMVPPTDAGTIAAVAGAARVAEAADLPDLMAFEAAMTGAEPADVIAAVVSESAFADAISDAATLAAATGESVVVVVGDEIVAVASPVPETPEADAVVYAVDATDTGSDMGFVQQFAAMDSATRVTAVPSVRDDLIAARPPVPTGEADPAFVAYAVDPAATDRDMLNVTKTPTSTPGAVSRMDDAGDAGAIAATGTPYSGADVTDTPSDDDTMRSVSATDEAARETDTPAPLMSEEMLDVAEEPEAVVPAGVRRQASGVSEGPALEGGGGQMGGAAMSVRYPGAGRADEDAGSTANDAPDPGPTPAERPLTPNELDEARVDTDTSTVSPDEGGRRQPTVGSEGGDEQRASGVSAGGPMTSERTERPAPPEPPPPPPVEKPLTPDELEEARVDTDTETTTPEPVAPEGGRQQAFGDGEVVASRTGEMRRADATDATVPPARRAGGPPGQEAIPAAVAAPDAVDAILTPDELAQARVDADTSVTSPEAVVPPLPAGGAADAHADEMARKAVIAAPREGDDPPAPGAIGSQQPAVGGENVDASSLTPDAERLTPASLPTADRRPPTIRVWHDVPLMTADDVYLFNEGTHTKLYDKLGSHPRTVDGVTGTHFAVWAPNARMVSVVGEFNGWVGVGYDLAPNGGSGIWEGFLPGVAPGAAYKYHIVSNLNGYEVDKADPFALYDEVPPHTASVVWHPAYDWGDGDWMRERGARNAGNAPMSIYEVHLGSWRRVPEEENRPLTYRELAPELAAYVRDCGFTHVEFLPVMEHPFGGSWGYQVTGYFAPTSRFGTPRDFAYLVDYLHQAGIGVILDWVPSHFPTDQHGLDYFDGTHLYEHADPRQGFHPDWKSNVFNYGRNEVRSFLLSSALFWLDRFHADGLRVDGVASMLYLDYSREPGEWIANRYGGRENLDAVGLLKQLNTAAYGAFPDIQMVAEESTAWPMVSRPTYLGGLGFGTKWDMGWMHDTLEYMRLDPVYRQFHHNSLTFRLIYSFFENFVLPLSHDEVVYGKGSLLRKMAGDDWQKFANLRLLFGYQWAQSGKKLLFMGGEFGQWNEWNHDTSLDWHLLDAPAHEGVRSWLRDLNRAYREIPALHERDFDPAGFEWIDANDSAQSVASFIRWGEDGEDPVVIAANFTPLPRHNYRLGVPFGGFWGEILNSDAAEYGGSGQGNMGGVEAAPVPVHGRPHALTITVPPLGVVFFRRSYGS